MEKGQDLGCLIASASRGQKLAKLKNFSEFHFSCISGRHSVLGQDVTGAGRHWGNIPGAELRGSGGQWGRIFWGRKSGILIYNSNQPFFNPNLSVEISTKSVKISTS